MKTSNQNRLLVGLALAVLLSACSYSIKIPFVPDPTPEPAPDPKCGVECESSPTEGGSKVLKFLLGP